MKLTRKSLNLIIEKYLLEQDEEALEDELPPLDDEEEDELDADEEAELDDLEAAAEEAEAEEETGGDDDSAVVEEEPEEELVNLKLDFTLPGSSTKAMLNIVDSVVQISFQKPGKDPKDLNQVLADDPTKRAEIEDDIKGTMLAAIEKIKDPVNNRKIRLALADMLTGDPDLAFENDLDLQKNKVNVITKYS